MSAFLTIATPETVKEHLRKYSRFLRRDFLCVLVKTCAKHLQLHTSRDDWRTRTGMLKFFTRSWCGISSLLDDHSIFIGWYTKNFQLSERLLTNRKFSQFLYRNWAKYKQFLSLFSTEEFMQNHQGTLSDVLNGKQEHIEELKSSETGREFVRIIEEFHEERNVNILPEVDAAPVEQIQIAAPNQLPVTITNKTEDEEPEQIQSIHTNEAFNEPYNFNIDDSYDIFNYDFNDDLVNCEDSAMPF